MSLSRSAVSVNGEHFLKEIRSGFMSLSLEYFDTNLALTATNRLKCAAPFNCLTVTTDGTKVIFHLSVGREELRLEVNVIFTNAGLVQ